MLLSQCQARHSRTPTRGVSVAMRNTYRSLSPILARELKLAARLLLSGYLGKTQKFLIFFMKPPLDLLATPTVQTIPTKKKITTKSKRICRPPSSRTGRWRASAAAPEKNLDY